MRRMFLLAVALLGGCSPIETAASPPAPSATLASHGRAGLQQADFVRDCDSSVYGELGRGWRQNAVVIGPIAFVGLPGLATVPKQRFESSGGRDRSEKVLAVVRTGPPVTVRVIPSGQVALLYDPSNFNAHGVGEGDGTVRFVPCEPGESPYVDFGAGGRATQFNGGFVVAGPRCAAIDVAVGNEPAERTWVSFGAGQSCPRS